jgi:hypothetical protein
MKHRGKPVKSGTATITEALHTYHLPEREDGICAYCQEYNTELGMDDCCVDDKYAMPSDKTCYKTRKQRALANGLEVMQGVLDIQQVNRLEGIAYRDPDTKALMWHKNLWD